MTVLLAGCVGWVGLQATLNRWLGCSLPAIQQPAWTVGSVKTAGADLLSQSYSHPVTAAPWTVLSSSSWALPPLPTASAPLVLLALLAMLQLLVLLLLVLLLLLLTHTHMPGQLACER